MKYLAVVLALVFLVACDDSEFSPENISAKKEAEIDLLDKQARSCDKNGGILAIYKYQYSGGEPGVTEFKCKDGMSQVFKKKGY